MPAQAPSQACTPMRTLWKGPSDLVLERNILWFCCLSPNKARKIQAAGKDTDSSWSSSVCVRQKFCHLSSHHLYNVDNKTQPTGSWGTDDFALQTYLRGCLILPKCCVYLLLKLNKNGQAWGMHGLLSLEPLGDCSCATMSLWSLGFWLLCFWLGVPWSILMHKENSETKSTSCQYWNRTLAVLYLLLKSL